MKSQGWTALIRDANGNGKRDAYVEPESAARSDQGSAHRRRALRRGAGARRLGLGHAARLPGRDHQARRPGANPPETALVEIYRAARRQSERPVRASRRAAVTSTATACTGRRWPAATSRASIAASARAR